jgi:hypothetical protein
MSRILATVEFAGEDAPKLLDLTDDDGWRLRGFAKGKFERMMDGVASTDEYGPADGEPPVRAAEKAARILGGKVVSIESPEPVPDDAVF